LLSFLRIIVRTLVAITMLVAMFQGAGRVGMQFLEALEPRINLALQESETRFEGLSGSWRGFNPIVNVEKLYFRGGAAKGLHLELDVFESLFRNRIVASRLRVADINVAISRNNQGRLTILDREVSDFDFASFLRYSHEIYIGNARVHPVLWGVDDAEALESDFLTIVALLHNTDMHRGQVYLSTHMRSEVEDIVEFRADSRTDSRTDPRCVGCEVLLQYAIAPGPLKPEKVGQGIAGKISVSAHDFTISKTLGALWGISGNIREIQGQINLSATSGEGSLELNFGAFDFPSGQIEQFVAKAELFVAAERDRYSLNISELGGLIEENILLTLVPGKQVLVEIPNLDLRTASELTGSALSDVEALSLWIDGLKASGELKNVALKYDLESHEFLSFGQIQNIGADEYRGIPYLRNVTASFVASRNAVALQLDSEAMQLGFKNLFADAVKIDRAQGELLIYFPPDYLGITGEDLHLQLGDAWLKGGFGLTRPLQVLDQKLFIAADIGTMHLNQAKHLMPVKLEPNLRTWLMDSIHSGEINTAEIAYHGDLRRHAGPPAKEIVLHFNVSDLDIRYEPSWPVVEGLVGDVFLTSKTVEASFSTADSLGIDLANLELSLPRDAAHVDLSLQGSGDFSAALAFIRQSPLAESMSFVDKSWVAVGGLGFSLSASIPVVNKQREVSAVLHFALDDALLDMPDYGLVVSNLEGSAEYLYPREVNSESVHGTLFGQAATFKFSTEDDVIRLNSEGAAGVDVVSEWLDLQHGGLVSGVFDYAAEMKFFPSDDATSVLTVVTSLEGVQLDFPSELHKLPAELWDVRIQAEFMDDAIWLGLEIPEKASGWWMFENNELSNGSLGIGIAPLGKSETSEEFVITGSLSTLDFTEVDTGTENEPQNGLQFTFSFPWAVHDLRLGQVVMGDLEFSDLLLQGRGTSDFTEFSVVSLDLNASYRQKGYTPPQVHIRSLVLKETLPKTAEGRELMVPDPLEDFDTDLLVDMDFVLDHVFVGDENYGSWSFKLRKSGEDIKLLDVEATVKGLAIRSESGVLWQPGNDRTLFNGVINGQDLADILPQWEYAPNIRSESLLASADVSWVGSPLNFMLEGLTGIGNVRVENGEFLDIEGATGPLRIFTLLNFSAVAKRFSGDFSDVFGKGIEFDSVETTANFDAGLITFVDALKVDGSSGSFEIEGTVNLNEETLDNTMIVTLPVSKALPWYAAWAAVANPVVGIGIYVGSKIIEGPLESFSSARYQISGPIDDPDVVFDGIFTKKMQGSRTRRSEEKPEKGAVGGAEEPVPKRNIEGKVVNQSKPDEGVPLVQELK